MAQQQEMLDMLLAAMPEGARPVMHSDYSEENAKPQKPMLSQLEGLAA